MARKSQDNKTPKTFNFREGHYHLFAWHDLRIPKVLLTTLDFTQTIYVF